MRINNVKSQQNFKSLYNIHDSKDKEHKFIKRASDDEVLSAKIKSLDKKGIDFHFVKRDKGFNLITLYVFKKSKNDAELINTVIKKVKNTRDVKTMLTASIKKAESYIK